SGAPAALHALVSIQHLDIATDNFVYDAHGRLAETDRNGNAEQVTYGYGPAGKVSATDANNASTQSFFDARGFLVKVMDPLGNTTHYTYDSNFNLTQMIDAAGQVTAYSYDQNGNLIKTTGPDGQTVAYSHTGPFSRMSSYTDPNHNSTNY